MKKEVLNNLIDEIRSFHPDFKILERDLVVIQSAKRLAILGVLRKSEMKMGFDEIVGKANVNASLAAYHVSQLKKYGFIEEQMMTGNEIKNTVVYGLTEKGMIYIDFIAKGTRFA